MAIISELHMALMRRNKMSFIDVTPLIDEMKERVAEGEDPEQVLEEEGLEPDYVFDLL